MLELFYASGAWLAQLLNGCGEWIIQSIHHHKDLAQIIIFMIAFIESFPILGSIFPGTIVLAPIGYMMGVDDLPFYQTACSIFLGAYAGDIVSYFIGYYFSDTVERSSWIEKNKNAYRWFKQFFAKYGTLSLLIGRFVGPLRSSVPLFAGLFGMTPVAFCVGIIPSVVAWGMAYIGSVYIVTKYFHTLTLQDHPWIRFCTKMPTYFWVAWLYVLGLYLLSNLKPFKDEILSLYYRYTLRLVSVLWVLIVLIRTGLLNSINNKLFTMTYQMMPAVLSEWISGLCSKDILLPTLTLFIVCKIVAGQKIFTKNAYYGLIAYMLLSIIMVYTLKALTMSPRPLTICSPGELYSFPSGHATLCTALILYMSIVQYPRNNKTSIVLAIGSIPLVVTVGLARMSLGLHSFTDILGGIVTGAIIALISSGVHTYSASDENITWHETLMLFVTVGIISAIHVYRGGY
jgi:membrane protein DedA with SNARE-associated domain